LDDQVFVDGARRRDQIEGLGIALANASLEVDGAFIAETRNELSGLDIERYQVAAASREH
jgi:hypothetical protein